MSNIKKLENLLKNEVLPEVNDNIKELKKEIKKSNTKENNNELKYMRDVEAYFKEALLNIENRSMTEEIAHELLEGLEEMQIDEDDV